MESELDDDGPYDGADLGRCWTATNDRRSTEDRSMLVDAQRRHCLMLNLDAAVLIRNVSYGGYSAQVSSARTESDRASKTPHDVDDAFCEPRDSKAFGGGGVAGILYKWVIYGKGWRSRWFLLEDGVLSYYKVHGQDKILMSPAREKGVTVMEDESVRYMKKANWIRNRLGVYWS